MSNRALNIVECIAATLFTVSAIVLTLLEGPRYPTCIVSNYCVLW